MKAHFLTILRNSATPPALFRAACRSLSELLLAEAANHIPLRQTSIHTPLGPTQGKELANRVVLVPILRAGLALLPAGLSLFSSAPVGFLGIRRDEKTAQPHLYYQNIPHLLPTDWVLLLDPMLATGGSSLLAFKKLREAGAHPRQMILISVVAAQEGVEAMRAGYPEATLVIGAIDPSLNAQKFIVPGLGDFGDRYFDTANLSQ